MVGNKIETMYKKIRLQSRLITLLPKYLPLAILPLVLAVILTLWTNLVGGNFIEVYPVDERGRPSAHEIGIHATLFWDLRDADFENNIYRLMGPVEMIDGAFLTPGEFAAREHESTPEYWFYWDEQYGTSRARILLPENRWVTFSRMSIDHAHVLYVNGLR